MPYLPKVFISHTTQDERDFALAHYLAEGLRERGAKVWVAPENILAGSQWEQEIMRGLKECSHFLVILSAASATSEWVLKEIDLALQRYTHDPTFHILPLFVGQISDSLYPKFLSELQKLTYRQDLSAQLDEVATAVGLPSAIWPRYLQRLLRELEYLNLSPVEIKKLPIDTLTPIYLIGTGKDDEGKTSFTFV